MIQMGMAIAGVTLASVWDIKVRRIPNWLTFSMILAGFILNSYDGGMHGFEQSFLGLAIGIFCLFVPFTLGGVGAGDVKLLGALGSLLGPVLIFKIILVSAIVGGIFSIVFVIGKHRVRDVFREIKNKMTFFMLTRKVLPENSGASHKLSIPYACAIALGTIAVVFLRG